MKTSQLKEGKERKKDSQEHASAEGGWLSGKEGRRRQR